jgi:hypothetical protein
MRMTIEQIACAVLDACEAEKIEHMLTGAFAHGLYGIPRSTKDVDIVISVLDENAFDGISTRLSAILAFESQFQFDTMTWGRRLVGKSVTKPPFKVELFELFDDPFVQSQFSRRRMIRSKQLQREVWVPTPEDVIVQKIRWARSKDLEDARDVMAVQGHENLDMNYIRMWCESHGHLDRFKHVMSGIALMD